MVAWAKDNGLAAIDLGNDADTLTKKVREAGLLVGSADLQSWSGLISSDESKRKETLDKNREYVKAVVDAGATNFFAVMLPEDPSKPRKDNFDLMIEGLKPLAEILDANGAKLVIEGWPGPGALCCTPEGYRAAIDAVDSDSIGINYDPSHLLRMGIDPIRFLREFKDRVYHVHGKDTEIISEAYYEYGTEQPATFAKSHGFGAWHWRYTIPGHGITRWTDVTSILEENGYKGAICIELEDENFNGTDAGEQAGILAGATYLASC
jgi:sugar phosphate isomerase/epimerase